MDVELTARKEPGSEETPPDITCAPVSFLNWQLCNDQKSHRRSTVSHTYTSIFRQTHSPPINFFFSCIYRIGASYIFLLTGLPHASLIELYAAQAASTIRSFLICFLVHCTSLFRSQVKRFSSLRLTTFSLSSILLFSTLMIVLRVTEGRKSPIQALL
jgi:hypothetical protein